MKTASVRAPAAPPSIRGLAAPATCESCGGAFKRRTSERTCHDCLAPLCRIRKAADLTQAELARRVGCRRSTITELERAFYHPQLELARAIARELGREVLEVFPEYAVTAEEAASILSTISQRLVPLIEAGHLPCDEAEYWHRIPYGAVMAIKAERDAFAAEWISFERAAREYVDLEPWVLRRWVERGDLTERLGDGRVGRKGGRYVRRAELRALVEREESAPRVCANPNCLRPGEPLAIGRLTHHACMGALASAIYWDPEAEGAADLRREHGETTRKALEERPEKSKRLHWWRLMLSSHGERQTLMEIAAKFYARFGSTAAYGWAAPERAREKGKQPGMPEHKRVVTPEKRERILKLAAELKSDGKPRHSQRAIARIVGVTRGSVEHELRKQREKKVA
jgi:DNA-binding XRE family transcriptional regulator